MSGSSEDLTPKTLDKIKDRFLEDFTAQEAEEDKKRICKKYIEEELSSVFGLIKNLGGDRRVQVGKAANELRKLITEKMKEGRKMTCGWTFLFQEKNLKKVVCIL